MTFSTTSCILLLIDLQTRLMPSIAEHECVVQNAVKLARIANVLGVPVLATEQNPRGLGPNLPEIAAAAQQTFEKQFFDATREPDFETMLPPGRRDFVVAGCEAHVCVLQTVMGLRRRGHAVRLVRDAIGSRLASNRDAAAHRAGRCGAELVTTEMVAFEWLATAQHPKFREALALLK